MKKILGLFLLAAFLSGCATGLSDLQRRSIESKDLEGSLDNAFKATMAVLQDRGFVIKHTDSTAGVIQAETGMKSGFLQEYNYVITATLEQFGENRVKERITITKNIVVQGMYGSRSESSVVVDDPKMLQEIYEQIQKEIFIRKNLSK
ncbi:MAG: hypothetical protein PHF11_01095 [Candidatus Omnitrophica bacterium]|nr:hypothetical protein [Candidatus Omnitrophota bacterium]